jgi:hypothetical protein
MWCNNILSVDVVWFNPNTINDFLGWGMKFALEILAIRMFVSFVVVKSLTRDFMFAQFIVESSLWKQYTNFFALNYCYFHPCCMHYATCNGGP